MVQRNLLREGFVFNTRTPLGTISGSQTVTPLEIDRLADADVSTTALTVSGSRFISLDADLGARFKLDRVELRTAETAASNFDIFVSDDGSSFVEVTMTGSPGVYASPIGRFSTTYSGSPRFIRYEHRGVVNTDVQEWSVVSDDTFVDFGSDGNLTELEIEDAPVGKPSDSVTTLTLFNRFSQPAEGFVFIDRTQNDAEAQIEVALSTAGPWFGKGSSPSLQPEVTDWSAGSFFQSREIPSGTLTQHFADGDAKGWAATGASFVLTDSVLRATSSTLTPRLHLSSDFTDFRSNVFHDLEQLFYEDHLAFRAVDVNRVRVRLKVNSSIEASNLAEGPRLFWRNHEEESTGVFRTALSALPIGGDRPPTGGVDSLLFDVGSVPTWSGTIRGFGVQPFVVVTGTGYIFELHGIEAYYEGGDTIGLDFKPVNSGTFADTNPNDKHKFTRDSVVAASNADTNTMLSTRHVVMQDSIITRVRWFAQGNPAGASDSIFLARPLSTTNFPATGTNFSVPYAIRIGEATNVASYREFDVFWSAKKGDVIGASVSNAGGLEFYYSSVSGTLGDAYKSTTAITTTSLTTLTNGLNDIAWTNIGRNYLIGYDATPTELLRLGGTSPYLPTGTYRTPVLDVGLSPALVDLSLTSVEPTGTSIDTLGASGFKTVRARASDIPPRNSLGLGETGTVDGESTTLFLHLNDSASLNLTAANVHQLNTNNSLAATRESVAAINNYGGAILYHEEKDQLWVMNCIISGSSSFLTTDVRPVWDIFTPSTGEYVGTQKVNGNLFYSYQHPTGGSANNHAFEPVGFAADYGRNEIYIFQREDAFFVGAGSYHGLVTDLNGTFKDVFWRSDTVGPPNANRLTTTIGFTYAPTLQQPGFQTTSSGIFFTLNNNSVVATQDNKGILISAYRNGRDSDLRNVRFINEQLINAIPGLGWVNNPPDARGIVYNKRTGLLNLFFDSQLPANNTTGKEDGLVITLRPTYNETTSAFEYTVVGSGNIGTDAARNVNGYRRTNAGLGPDWNGSSLRFSDTGDDGTGFTTGIAHNTTRDTFAILRTYESDFSQEFPSETAPNNLTDENHSFLAEVGAGSSITLGAGRTPHTTDPRWGTLSGTLTFSDISTQGFNFPTGRYAQVEYQLNTGPISQSSPLLLTSHLAQGIRVGTIPAGGTKDIYVRTNIPEDQEVGDQLGRLKVVWETLE